MKPKDEAEVYKLQYKARSKILIQYDNDQKDDPPKPQQQAIWRVWLEDQMYEHKWDATDAQKGGSCANTGNRKRQARASCSKPERSLLTSGISTGPTDSAGLFTGSTAHDIFATRTSVSSGASSPASPSKFYNSLDSRSTITSNIPGPTYSSAVPSSTFSLSCYPFSDPDAGPASPQCMCDGLDGTFPYLSFTSGAINFDPCGYTIPPTKASTSAAPPFIITESNGEVVSCASSAYYNYAVNTIPTCAGSTTIVSTIASIASAYSASESASAASASASWASAAAVPSAGCWILNDDGFGDSAFQVYGINGWAGSDGSKLFNQESGCGILSGFEFYTDRQEDFKGRLRDTQYALFGLSFFKGGCVERAVHSAGGPQPGDEPGQLTCKRGLDMSNSQLKAAQNIVDAQLKAVKAVADGRSVNSSVSTKMKEKLAIDASASFPTPAAGSQPNPILVTLAKAALPYLLITQQNLSAALLAKSS